MIIILVMITCVGCDQAAKTYAALTLAHRQPIVVFGELFRVRSYREHRGDDGRRGRLIGGHPILDFYRL